MDLFANKSQDSYGQGGQDDGKDEVRSTLVGRSITVYGKRTSVRLEPEMWEALKYVSRKERCTIHNICTLALAQQFNLPVITLVDTAGAYPGVGAEERGQSEAIAKSIESCLRAEVPIISVIIGEGGSGGAIAIATADRVYMLEHAIYSVISPEGCASILWKTADFAKEAAASLKLTAQDLTELKLIDGIIEEPMGGAHRNKQDTILNVANQIEKGLKELTPWNGQTLIQKRREKFLQAGRHF